MPLLPALADYLADLDDDVAALPDERRGRLDRLAEYIRERLEAGGPARLTFICTHNSRRSHISQLWAAAAAAARALDGVDTYSGGTEATAFNPRAVAALRRAGFEIADATGDNPRYSVRLADDRPPLICYSKTYDDPANPQRDFAAVMTCSDADQGCPVVRGAGFRVALPWDDPKAADDTPEEAATYDARVRQIAAEMAYLFSQV